MDRRPMMIDGPVPQGFDHLVAEIRSCWVCAPYLPLGPRPVLRGRPSARLLTISQARRVNETILSGNDCSGDWTLGWLALDRETFYDEARVAIIGTGVCYPGGDGKGGDRPPHPECAPPFNPQSLDPTLRSAPCLRR